MYVTRNTIPRKNISDVFKQYICGKNRKDFVKQKIFKVGVLRKNIFMVIPLLSNREVYISTLALMHIYERRGVVLEGIVLPYFNTIIRFPDGVYLNKEGKNRRGQILFTKKIEGHYLAAIFEMAAIQGKTSCQIITIFICNHNYFESLKCLWNGRTATPSSQCNNS